MSSKRVRHAEVEDAYLDDAVIFRIRVQGVLDIALADDTKVPDDIHGSRSKHVVVLIGQSLRRSNDDRITRMDTQWIEIL